MRRHLGQLVYPAFIEVRDGLSADRVVADPELNTRFLSLCRQTAPNISDTEFNLALLNLRKAGLLKGLPRSKRTTFPNEDAYRYASEIAARHIERRDATTLDRIICDSQLVLDFDRIASTIASGYSSLQYRWAALNLRKARSLRPELISQVIPATGIRLGRIEEVQIDELPMQQGLYIFYGPSDTLYVGEGTSLRRRVAKHLDHSDNRNLARWFWEHGFQEVHLEIQTLGNDVSTKVRRALEAELIKSRRPIFNVKCISRDDN